MEVPLETGEIGSWGEPPVLIGQARCPGGCSFICIEPVEFGKLEVIVLVVLFGPLNSVLRFWGCPLGTLFVPLTSASDIFSCRHPQDILELILCRLGVWPMVLCWVLVPPFPFPAGPWGLGPVFWRTGQAPWLAFGFKVLGFIPTLVEDSWVPHAFILPWLLSASLLLGPSPEPWHVISIEPLDIPQGPLTLPLPTLLLPFATMKWEPCLLPLLSPPVLPDTIILRFFSDPELEAESASIHSEANSGSLPVMEGQGPLSTITFPQLLFESLQGEPELHGEFSYWGSRPACSKPVNTNKRSNQFRW